MLLQFCMLATSFLKTRKVSMLNKTFSLYIHTWCYRWSQGLLWYKSIYCPNHRQYATYCLACSIWSTHLWAPTRGIAKWGAKGSPYECSVVHRVPCSVCSASFVGQTRRRKCQHPDECRRVVVSMQWLPSLALAERAWIYAHPSYWVSMTVLANPTQPTCRPQLATESKSMLVQTPEDDLSTGTEVPFQHELL